MIAQIVTHTEYGTKQDHGVLIDYSLTTETSAFAHSMQDAENWLLEFPLFQDATIDRFENGSVQIQVTSRWMDDPFAGVYNDKINVTRQRVIIRTVNTIYENVGYARFQKETA